MLNQRYATAVTCRNNDDDPAITWMKTNYHVDTIDIIAGQGMIGTLANDPEGKTTQAVLEKIMQSRNTHGSDLVAVIAHEGCTRDAASKETQYHYLNAASDHIYMTGYPGDIIRLWVSISGTVEQLP